MAAQLGDAHFKGHACPQRCPFENKRCGLPRKRPAHTLQVILEFTRKSKKPLKLLRCPEGERDKITFHEMGFEKEWMNGKEADTTERAGTGYDAAPAYSTGETDRRISPVMA